VRSWLHLPGDVTNDFIHAKVKDGGLGVYQHTVLIRLSRKVRIESLIARSTITNDPALKWLVDSSEHLRETTSLRHFQRRCSSHGQGES
jgi:hypothetical protein